MSGTASANFEKLSGESTSIRISSINPLYLGDKTACYLPAHTEIVSCSEQATGIVILSSANAQQENGIEIVADEGED